MDLATELGTPASVVINREIAEFMIGELRAFLAGSNWQVAAVF
jgi:hypothetical protein